MLAIRANDLRLRTTSPHHQVRELNMSYHRLPELISRLNDINVHTTDFEFSQEVSDIYPNRELRTDSLESDFLFSLVKKDFLLTIKTLFDMDDNSNSGFKNVFVGFHLFLQVIDSKNTTIQATYISILTNHFDNFKNSTHPCAFLGIRLYEGGRIITDYSRSQIDFCIAIIKNLSIFMPNCEKAQFYRPSVKSFFREMFYSFTYAIPALIPVLKEFDIEPVDFFTSTALTITIKADDIFSENQIAFLTIPSLFSFLFKQGEIPLCIAHFTSDIIKNNPELFT